MKRSRRRAALVPLLLISFTVACSKPPELTRPAARSLIEAAPAFQAPIDEDIALLDTRLKDNPYMKREVLKIDAVTTKPDGPFGLAGATATVKFTWRWNQGPLARQSYRTLVKLHSSGEAWKVYDDQLQHGLRTSMGGEE